MPGSRASTRETRPCGSLDHPSNYGVSNSGDKDEGFWEGCFGAAATQAKKP